MTGTFLIIYIIGAIAAMICMCGYFYRKLGAITLGDIIFCSIMSIASWFIVIVFTIAAIISMLDSIVIFKKKNK